MSDAFNEAYYGTYGTSKVLNPAAMIINRKLSNNHIFVPNDKI